ncbi:MAG: phage tail protein [Mongoliibacter sp.]|jgi:phage tail-like protein|uniref:phage tail protein n=1 Tax=Mongoliibacter sp. TaxID=2022438 RepID=UPI0012EF5C51|nr:phage tail protein [Mongoliibacter sp.]TVP46485.1 MAG: phage tail protein [Mongoliibacter sp.]
MGENSFFQDGYAPPTAFYFQVKFKGFPEMDCSFQEVSGLKVTVKVTEKREGGENKLIHYLPSPSQYSDLVLKRCLINNSSLGQWCRNALENFKFKPLDFQVFLLGPNGKPMTSWTVFQAIPLSWELSALSSTKNELAIETLTIKYKFFKKDN